MVLLYLSGLCLLGRLKLTADAGENITRKIISRPQQWKV